MLALAAMPLFACGGDDDGSGDGIGSDTPADASSGGGGGGGGGAADSGSGGGADAATGTGTIECGDDTCDAETEECCVGEGGQTCVPLDSCETQTFTCDGPEDCGEQVCCAAQGGGEGGTGCADPGTCGGSVICRSTEDCPDGQECCNVQQQGMSPIEGFCSAHCPGPPN
jgi:hypothetical protein